MKQILLSVFSILFMIFTSAQEVPKNILVEHYTNSYCSTCASKNPTFYNTIAPYDKVVHIAYHPSSPYAACPLNQHNSLENDARTNYYNIYGSTPRAVVNGTVIPVAINLITNSPLDQVNNETSPFDIEIEQFQAGNDSMYTEVTIRTVATTSIQNATILLALSEKTLNFSAQNGETVHSDVFRKFLVNNTLSLPVNGTDTTITIGSIIDQEWTANQLTTTAILQNDNTKEVLQAAQSDKLDFSTGISLHKVIDKLLYPNPSKDFLHIDNQNKMVKEIEIYSVIGSLIEKIELNGREEVKLSVVNYEEGNYIVRIYDIDNNIYTRKIMVDF